MLRLDRNSCPLLPKRLLYLTPMVLGIVNALCIDSEFTVFRNPLQYASIVKILCKIRIGNNYDVRTLFSIFMLLK